MNKETRFLAESNQTGLTFYQSKSFTKQLKEESKLDNTIS